MERTITNTLALLVAGAACTFAQLGPATAPAQGTVAAQLPLSGRGGQTGSVAATQSPTPGTTTSVNTLNATVQTTGAFAGSASSISKVPFSGKLSFREAVQRGLDYNLGTVGLNQAVRQSHGQKNVARSSLLPNLIATASETEQQTNLAVAGIRFRSPVPGSSFPSIVGPFNYFDLRARLTQSVADMTAWRNYRSAEETARANEFSLQDARELVVLAVGGAYLQVIAAKARVEAAQSQLDTATALVQQSSQKRAVGLLAQIDVNRSRVQMLTEQERLATLGNDLSKQKINLARLTGLPANDQFDVSDEIPFSAAPDMKIDDALERAYAHRQDLKAATAQIHASELTRSAARAERYPSLALNADYGANGLNPNNAHGTFSVTGTLTVPIWRGGRAEGDIEQADAVVAQRQAEIEDLRGKIEGDVRSAFLDMQAAAKQIEVADQNRKVTKETLDLTRQKFQAGVSDNVEVVQAQESVANAELDYINSVFAHNVAKLSLARAVGEATNNLSQFLTLP